MLHEVRERGAVLEGLGHARTRLSADSPRRPSPLPPSRICLPSYGARGKAADGNCEILDPIAFNERFRKWTN